MIDKTNRLARGPARRWAMLLGLATAICAGDAAAMPTCQGTYAATLLQPLPPRPVVAMDIHDASPRNQELADRFLAGVHSAGVGTGPQPNVLLHISTSLLWPSLDGRDSGTEQSFPGLSGIEGWLRHVPPKQPRIRRADPRARPARPLLIMRVDATEGTALKILWVASIQCEVTGSDDAELAEDLGHLVGRALGQRVERSAL